MEVDARPDHPDPNPPALEQPAVVLIAHGSRNQGANDDHVALCEAIERRRADVGRGGKVLPAFLEIAEPSIPDAIDLAARDSSEVRILPLFINQGNHVSHDIPEIVEEARQRHPAIDIRLLPHVGADPRFADLVVDLSG